MSFFLEKYFDRLFLLNRSITGEGYRKSLDILSEVLPFKYFDFKTGTKCFDWIIPKEWNVKEAYILTPNGRKVAEFKKNNLHLVGYSISINKEISFEELKKHLYYLKNLPDAIPYVTSYYQENWGFCLSYNEFKKLPKKGLYKVKIDSTLKKGILRIGTFTIPGKSKKEILLSTYLCHPSMANNELSGPLMFLSLYKILKNEKKLNYTIRFVICPENIGSISVLSRFGEHFKKNVIAGFVTTCVGYGEIYYYKKSRNGNTVADKAALNILKNQKKKYKIIDFFAGGSDEKQYCTPYFDLPIGLIMRDMYGKYKEYHTSLDNKSLIDFKKIAETAKLYFDVIKTIDENKFFLAKVQKGTPFLAKYKRLNFPHVSNFNSYKIREKYYSAMLEILNLCDGKNSLLDIAELRNFKMLDLLPITHDLLQNNLLRKK